LTDKRIWVAGHLGLVGSALCRRLEREPIGELITATSSELDLRRQEPTEAFIADTRPDAIIVAAARVGGINANRQAQGEFLYDNVMIAANVLEAARRNGVERIVLLGSSCIYPKHAHQPIGEDQLLAGPLEETNEGYAIAKIAALEMAKMYRRQYGTNAIALMPTNLYGPNDNFDPVSSHVLPALIRRFHDARTAGLREVTIWGSGRPRREFMHVDDFADACLHVTRVYDGDTHMNIGVGEDISIREVAELVADIVGWSGVMTFDTTMPDGTPRKLLDVSRLLGLGWKPSIDLREGIASTYKWYLEHDGGHRR
jgi:GDP-L-fucose synthase